MKRLFLVLAAGALAAGCTSTVIEGAWLIPEPEDGEQYRIAEICDLLATEGYDIGGSLAYTVTADELGFLDDLPGLVRAPAEAAIGDGIGLTLRLNGLCQHTG